MDNLRRYVSEFLGTFLLVFVVAGFSVMAGKYGIGGLIEVAIVSGLIVMVVVYSFGKISGAHINPALTLGFVSTGRFPKKEGVFYVISQTAGGILSGASLLFFFDDISKGLTVPGAGLSSALVFEILLTFILMLVAMEVSTSGRSQIGGALIGSAVALNTLFGAKISGASMNPARSFGPALASLRLSFNWIYWVGPIAGAVLASWLFQVLTQREVEYERYGLLGPVGIEEEPEKPGPLHGPEKPHPP